MRLLILLLAGILLSGPTFAATITSYEIIGFSKDGKRFAFEEYSVGDGAGIPRSSIYVIDIAADKWVAGSPFRAIGDEDKVEIARPTGQTYLQEIRDQARAKAKRALDAMKPFQQGTTRFSRSVYDFTSDAKEARFSSFIDNTLRGIQTRSKRLWQLKLEETNVPRPAHCENAIYGDVKGMKLTITDEKTGASNVLSEGKRIPKSRQCPTLYRIEKVVTLDGWRTPAKFVIFIRYATFGFEGSDGNLIAVTHIGRAAQ